MKADPLIRLTATSVATLIGCALILFGALPLGAADTPGVAPSPPMRVAVLGSAANGADASAATAALVHEERERGITINTSHVEYRTVHRGGRAEFVEEAAGTHFGAAVLVSSGPDPLEVLEAAQLTSLLGIQPVFLLLVGGPYQDTQLAAVQKGLLDRGYSADNSRIYVTSLDGPPCPSNEDIADLWDELATHYTHPDPTAPLLLAIDEVLNTPNGLTAYGTIESGVAEVGDPVEIVGFNPKPAKSSITGVEMFRKILDRGEAGDNCGLLLRGIDKKDIRRGMVIVKPGSTTAHRQFTAEIYVLKKEEGGRHTPFHNKYRPQFYCRTTDVTGEITLESGREMLMAGDNGSVNVKLIVPVAMDKGLRFAIREGGRTIGVGQVTELGKPRE
jgi:elongation factor Tu